MKQIGLLIMLAVPGAVLAQNDSVPAAANGGGATFFPLPVLFYQTETGTGFGAGVSYVIDAPRSGPKAGRSDGYSAGAIYTTKHQVITWLSGELFPAGRVWITANAGFSRFPTKLWGVGNDTPEDAEEDYTPQTFALVADAQLRLRRQLWAGLTLDLVHRRFVERTDGGLLAEGLLPGGVDGRVTGVGVLVTWDTRSSSLFPRSGGVYQLRMVGYAGVTGSDFGFTRVTLDMRRYLTSIRNHVVALHVTGTATGGAPPFDYMPDLGGELLLRGYYQGRFRDRHRIVGQAEYRAPVWWRFGAVAFIEAGQVAPRWGDFALHRFRTAVGAGVRFRISPDGLHLRADFARGLVGESSGFYLGIGEAF